MYIAFNTNNNGQIVTLHHESGEAYQASIKSKQQIKFEYLSPRDIRHLNAAKIKVQEDNGKNTFVGRVQDLASNIASRAKQAFSSEQKEIQAPNQDSPVPESPNAAFKIDEESDIQPEPVGMGRASLKTKR